jgi:hypothetical protein
MLKFNYVYLSVILVSSPVWSMKFSAPINRLQLPVMISTEQPPEIKYTPPGEISMSALSTCGDGDVEHFADNNPTFEYIPPNGNDIDVVLGYWVVEEGASGNELVPNQNNWFPIAYKKLPIKGKNDLVYVDSFLPITHADIGSSVKTMDLLKFDLMNLHSLAKSSFQSNKNYRIYAAALGCNNPDGADSLVPRSSPEYTYKASPLESLRSLEDKLPTAVNDLFASTSVLNDLLDNSKLKIDLKSSAAGRNVPSASPNPYDYSFHSNNGSNNVDVEQKASQLFGIYKKIMLTEYPLAAADVDAYKTAIAASDWSSAVSGYSVGDQVTFCNSVGAISNKDAKVYQNLEAFSMNLACKNLFSLGDLDNAFKALTNPIATKPTLQEFNSLIKTLAKRFFLAASFQAAQVKMDETLTIARSGCFKKPEQPHLIDRIIVAYPFLFNVEGGKYVIKGHQYNTLHPEQLFALVDYVRYFANDTLAIWGQVVPGQNISGVNALQGKSINLKLNNKQNLQDNRVEESSFSGNAITINFMIRSLGQTTDGTTGSKRACIWKC